ncbi:MAG: type I 3-dehydroquinate dehydratase [Pseudoramibacter sp.]
MKTLSQSFNLEPQTFALCVPIGPKTEDALPALLNQAASAKPDLIEWRRDALGLLSNAAQNACLDAMAEKQIPILYTFRDFSEGGACSEADDDFREAAILKAIEHPAVACVDIEASQSEKMIKAVRKAARHHEKQLILSYHNFKKTLKPKALKQKLYGIAEKNPDVIKIAMQADSKNDILQANYVILHFLKKSHWQKPIIFIIMGDCGKLLRVAPEYFGGSLTYAALSEADATAPGQLTPDQIRQFRKALHL